MASHLRKKQFQSSSQQSIRSYFERTSNNQENEQTRSQPVKSTLSPPVPDQVQSLLINVGMRVRKSVPEGYKTHKTIPQEPVVQPQRPPPSSAPASYMRSTELQPFCGLHTIGGIASQQSRNNAFPPALTYSQETLPSSGSSFGSMTATANALASTKKRSYNEDIEDELDAFFDEEEGKDLMMQTTRPIARPRGRGKVTSTEMIQTVNGDFDDEDAAFLQPMEED